MPRWNCDTFRFGALLVCLTLTFPGVSFATPKVTARSGLGLAEQAADAWADDARLVWVENDAPVDDTGRAGAWGYLFWSPAKGSMRSWSVRDGKLDVAEDHSVTAPARGLDSWVDSDAIVAGARSRALDAYESGCTLDSLLLVHGVFDKGAAWVAVFSTPDGPSIYVVCDAASGRILRDWRG